MTVKLKGGKRYSPKNTDPVHCQLHDVTVAWGDLDPIQQLAVEEGIDAIESLPCLLASTPPAINLKEKT